MNSERLQGWIDEIRTTSKQRFALCIIALVMPAVACAATAAASHNFPLKWMLLIVALSAVGAVRPDSHVVLVVIGLDIWLWVAMVDDANTAWAVMASFALFVFHATTAFMSTTPHSATVDRVTLRRWFLRSCGVTLTAGATWLLVLGLDRRHPTGNALLTSAALSVLIAATLLMRARSLGRH